MPILVYRYGLRPPTTNADLVREQLRLAHRYRNVLTEIERGRRAAIRAIVDATAGVPALATAFRAADAEAQAADRTIKITRAETRSRSETDAMHAVLRDASDRRDAAARTLRLARNIAMGDVDPWLDAFRRGETTGLPDVDCYLAARVAAEDDESGPNSATKSRLRAEREEVACAIRASGADVHPVHRVATLDAINLCASGLRRNARAYSGLPYGTYLLVEAAADQASKDTPLWNGAEPGDPGFVPWDGEGQIGVQIQGGLACSAALGDTSTVLRIEKLPWRGDPQSKRAATRAFANLHLRVGSDGRAPVWAIWPVMLHRPLPENATIKQAAVCVRRIGPREEWYATLTVSLDETTSNHGHCGTGAVGVDLGWRVRDDALRVAYWMGEDGEKEEFRLDPLVLSGLHKADELRSIRDRRFNAARDALVAWLRERGMPDWMRALTVRRGSAPPTPDQALAYLEQWRSPARLAALARTWREVRTDADSSPASRTAAAEHADLLHAIRERQHAKRTSFPEPGARKTLRERQRAELRDLFGRLDAAPLDGLDALEAWRYRDFHLWTWESSQRTGALRRRREVYRAFSITLAKRYETLVIEDFNLSRVARRPRQSTVPENETARSNRQIAAVSELRTCLVQAFQTRGGRIVKVPAPDTTRVCAVLMNGVACGSIERWNQAKELHHTCSRCDTPWDQDENAAENLLLRRHERSGGEEEPGGAREDGNRNGNGRMNGSRWTRAAEKREKNRTTRETAGKPT